MTPPPPPPAPPQTTFSSPPSFSSFPRNLQPTFSSCAAAAGKVAGALSQALAFNEARAPLRHKEGGWVGWQDSRSLGAGSRAPTGGGKSGGWDGWEQAERRGRGDLSAGAGGGCRSRMSGSPCCSILWSGRERNPRVHTLDAAWREGGDTNSAEDTDGINYSVSISISATCLTRLSISCQFSMGQALVSFRRISSVFAETGEKCVNLSLHLEFGFIVREQSLVN